MTFPWRQTVNSTVLQEGGKAWGNTSGEWWGLAETVTHTLRHQTANSSQPLHSSSAIYQLYNINLSNFLGFRFFAYKMGLFVYKMGFFAYKMGFWEVP